MKRTIITTLFLTLSLLFTISCSTFVKEKSVELSQEYQSYTSTAYYLKVRGMVCITCVNGLKQELKKDSRIQDVEVDLEKEEVFVKTSVVNSNIKQYILKSLQVRGLDLLSILQK